MQEKNSSANALPLSSADSGKIYSAAVAAMLLMNVVFSVAVMIVSKATGMETEEIQGTFLYNFFSFFLSPLALTAGMAVFFALSKKDPVASLPRRKVSPVYYLIAVLLACGLFFGASELNAYFTAFLEKLGLVVPPMKIPLSEWWHLAVWLVVAAVLPAVVEEILFRGYICEGLRGLPTAAVVFAGGALFSLFHMNPQQTVYQFACGAVFFLLAVKSGSVLPCILMHFLNNAAVLAVNFFGFAPSGKTELALVISGLAALAAGILVLCLMGRGKKDESGLKREKTGFSLCALPGILICALMWIMTLFTYFGN